MLGTIVINPAPESLQAVKIITGNYTADIGKSNSAVLPMETKSGSNSFHGLISDFRTSAANLARNPDQAIQSPPRGLAAALFFYGTDTWRVTSKLMVNYGLRWEIVFPERINAPGHGSHLDLDTGNLLVAGVGDVSLNMNYKTTWGNLAPRLGFSYQLDKSSVIRAGYGRSFAMGTFGTLFAVDSTSSLPVYAIQSLNATTVKGSVFDLATGPPDYIFPTVPDNGMLPQGDCGESCGSRRIGSGGVSDSGWAWSRYLFRPK